jgi:AcrR family transcriptional regulator
MTDSPGTTRARTGDARPGKRERLVDAALELVYRNGVEKTTLAEIAQAADVPLGNVYYYFKTKEDIVEAVIEAHVASIEESIATVERRHRTPKGRLKALVGQLADQRDVISRSGCPHGSLCSELEKRPDGGDHAAARLMQLPIDWVESQFRSIGRPDAHDLAVELLTAYQGTAVLTQALRQPELMAREARRLKRWIDDI